MTEPEKPTQPSKPPQGESAAELRQLARLSKWKAGGIVKGPQPQPLGQELVRLFKQEIEPLHRKVGKVAEVWMALVPQMFQERTALVSFRAGTLTVAVDSAPHLYELQLLLRAGLQKQILLAGARHGLKKITLRRGGAIDPPGNPQD